MPTPGIAQARVCAAVLISFLSPSISSFLSRPSKASGKPAGGVALVTWTTVKDRWKRVESGLLSHRRRASLFSFLSLFSLSLIALFLFYVAA